MTTWEIRRWPMGREPNPEFPWRFTMIPEDTCGAGGHFGEVESFDRALECVAAEAAEHAANE